MGFLGRGIREEDESDPEENDEEQYLKLVKKIGRDFVSIEDLKDLLDTIMITIDPLGLNPANLSDSQARSLAQRYEKLLDKGKGEPERDLIESKEEKEKKNKDSF